MAQRRSSVSKDNVLEDSNKPASEDEDAESHLRTVCVSYRSGNLRP